jgi:hypothetical protein
MLWGVPNYGAIHPTSENSSFYALVNKGKKRTGRGCKRAPTLVMRLQEVRIVPKAATGVCLGLYGGGTVPILATVLYPFIRARAAIHPASEMRFSTVVRLVRYGGEESVCSSFITSVKVSSISNERRTTPLSLPLISK